MIFRLSYILSSCEDHAIDNQLTAGILHYPYTLYSKSGQYCTTLDLWISGSPVQLEDTVSNTATVLLESSDGASEYENLLVLNLVPVNCI
eukprot:SAG11_NODE_2211_length_3672_cov_3.904855_1_plen_90_part_00